MRIDFDFDDDYDDYDDDDDDVDDYVDVDDDDDDEDGDVDDVENLVLLVVIATKDLSRNFPPLRHHGHRAQDSSFGLRSSVILWCMSLKR